MNKKSPKRARLPKIKYTNHDKVRQTPERSVKDEERSPFERDRSRIIHSAAFHRLQAKTQVVTVGEGDFLRTRLTHSLEVAQIGKGVALRLGADTDLVEAISLVHDIGHPPFGHAGEQELQSLMKPYGGFEANAQNIRVLTELETKSNDYNGLNLTRAVIDGQMKYKDTFDGQLKKFIYCDDADVMVWASDDAEAVSSLSSKGAKSFECQIMDWADDVAYAVHDLEDSIHTGYISFASLQDDRRRGEVIDRVISEFGDCSIDAVEVCNSFLAILRDRYPPFQGLDAIDGRQRQKANRKQLASFLINRYIKATQRIESVTIPKGQLSYRYWYRVYIPIQYKVEVTFIKKLIQRFVIESPQIRTLEEKGRYILGTLFCKFMQGDNAKALLPEDWRERLDSDHSQRAKARVVSDYISGMTDNYAQKTYARLYLPDKGSIYEML